MHPVTDTIAQAGGRIRFRINHYSAANRGVEIRDLMHALYIHVANGHHFYFTFILISNIIFTLSYCCNQLRWSIIWTWELLFICYVEFCWRLIVDMFPHAPGRIIAIYFAIRTQSIQYCCWALSRTIFIIALSYVCKQWYSIGYGALY